MLRRSSGGARQFEILGLAQADSSEPEWTRRVTGLVHEARPPELHDADADPWRLATLPAESMDAWYADLDRSGLRLARDIASIVELRRTDREALARIRHSESRASLDNASAVRQLAMSIACDLGGALRMVSAAAPTVWQTRVSRRTISEEAGPAAWAHVIARSRVGSEDPVDVRLYDEQRRCITEARAVSFENAGRGEVLSGAVRNPREWSSPRGMAARAP